MGLPSYLPQQANIRAYYALEDVNDGSANGYNLTNKGSVTFTPAKINNGANLGSSNSSKALYIENNLGITTGSITMTGWVKCLAEIGSGEWEIFHHSENVSGGSSALDNRIIYDYNAGTRRLIFRRYTNAADDVNYNITLGTSNFYHVAYVFNSSTKKVYGYVNGSLVGSVDSTSTTYTDNTTDGFRIGTYVAGDGYYYNYASMLVDETIVWNLALSDNEIYKVFKYSFKTGGVAIGSPMIF